jgi:hypothetical protein
MSQGELPSVTTTSTNAAAANAAAAAAGSTPGAAAPTLETKHGPAKLQPAEDGHPLVGRREDGNEHYRSVTSGPCVNCECCPLKKDSAPCSLLFVNKTKKRLLNCVS